MQRSLRGGSRPRDGAALRTMPRGINASCITDVNEEALREFAVEPSYSESWASRSRLFTVTSPAPLARRATNSLASFW